jgi:hypothetical protein
MIPLSTIDFEVDKARQNGRSTVGRMSFVLIRLSRQIELDEPQEVVTVHELCFLRRNSTFDYFAHIIVNILLVLIPTLVNPLCIFYDFVMLDGGFSCVPTTLRLDS